MSPDPSREVAPGDQVANRYQVTAFLGAGAMGLVLAATDLRLGRKVALKVVRKSGLDTIEKRLVREAQAAAVLEHPHIVPIYDVGTLDDGRAFLVMQWIDGVTLRDALEHSPPGPAEPRPPGTLSLGHFLAVAKDVAAGLDHAHRQGFVHRDIKPDNIMLRAQDGLALVLDFGLARRITGSVTRVTAEGAILGTPAYLAPEQARGEEVGPAADQFALAVTLWEATAGRVPWNGQSITEVLSNVLSQDPPPLGSVTVRPIPPAFEAALRRGLEKKPGDRFDGVAAMVDALEASLAGVTTPQRPSLPPRGLSEASGDFETLDAASLETEASLARAVTLPSLRPSDGEALVSGVSESVSASDSRATLSGPALPARIAVIGLLCLAIVGAAVMASRPPRAEPPAAAGDQGSVPQTTSSSVVDLPDPEGCEGEALAAYREGLTLLRSSNWHRASTSFNRAAEAGCPAGHLRVAMNGTYELNAGDPRRAFGEAQRLEGQLDARQSALLRAFAPLYEHDPPDLTMHGERLAELVDTFTDDPEILMLAAWRSDRARVERETWARQAVSLDPAYADAYQTLARLLGTRGARDEVEEVLRRCIEASPLSTDCHSELMLFKTKDGRCDELEALAREMRLRSPDSADAMTWLARSQVATGDNLARVRAVSERVIEALDVPDPVRELVALRARSYLASVEGDLEEVVQLGEALGDPQIPLGQTRATIRGLQVAALVELGRDEDAARVAAGEVVRWSSETPDPGVMWFAPEWEARILDAARPLLGEEAFEVERNDWRERVQSYRIDPIHRWALTDGWWARTPSDAVASLERLGALRGTPDNPPATFPTGMLGLGRVLALAGEPDRAKGWLRPIAPSCVHLDNAFLSVEATLALGDAEQATGNHVAACAAWRRGASLFQSGLSRTALRKRLEGCDPPSPE